MFRIPRAWLFFAVTAGLTTAIVSASVARRTQTPRHFAIVLCEPDPSWGRTAETKRRIVGGVIAGRLPLLQAAADFRAVDAGKPNRAAILRDAFPYAASDEEAYCRSVIAWVQATPSPSRPEGLAARLQDELDARLRAGDLRLPFSDGREE